MALRNPRIAVNVLLKDTSHQTLVQATDAWSLRRQFHIMYPANPKDKIIAKLVDNWNLTTKNLQFKTEGKTYTVLREAFQNRTSLMQDNEEIIFMEHSQSLGAKINYIKIVKDDLDIKLALCILHTFLIGV